MTQISESIDSQNTRLLLIDDNSAIHDDIRKILCGDQDTGLDDVEAQLFGASDPVLAPGHFDIGSAFQGRDGLEMVQRAHEIGMPYAMAFVDVRMPPGWDGIETVKHIWEVDPDLQIVICTAYSDYNWDDIVQQLGQSDNLVILKKPFDNIEVLQLAHALTKKWEVTRQAQYRMDDLDRMVQARTQDLEDANKSLKHEIAERSRAEHALRLSEARFSKAFKNSPMPMKILNLNEGRFVDVNDMYLEMTGLTADDIIGHTCDDLRIFNNMKLGDYITQQFQTGQPIRNEELSIQTSNGDTRQTSLFVDFFTLDNMQHALIIMQDVTERMKLEEQLRQAQKMEAVGQLTAGIAHDFNNLLTVIIGYVKMQLSNKEMDKQFTKPLERVSDAAERAANLTRQMLAFSSKQLIRPRVIHLNKSIEHLGKMINRIIEENIQCQYELDQELPYIYADDMCIDQILMNLAVNARDAMPDGGTLTFSTRAVDIDETRAQHAPDVHAGQYVCLSIIDSGCGMDEETVNRIFDPFYTTKDVGKGTGMGLAMVYGLVQQHEGWIEVDSSIGQGTRFNIYFPVTDKLETASVETTSTPQNVDGGNATVLLAEDAIDVRQFMQNVLEASGYQVVSAIDGLDALKVWQNTEQKIDILLTDVMMPNGMTGMKLAEKLMVDKPQLKVIYMTGYSTDLLNVDTVDLAEWQILQKPCTPEALLQTVHRCLKS